MRTELFVIICALGIVAVAFASTGTPLNDEPDALDTSTKSDLYLNPAEEQGIISLSTSLKN